MKNKIGFVIPKKENEYRRALLPNLIFNKAINTSMIYIEENYGLPFGIPDEDYLKLGINILNREKIFEICEIICDPKIGSTMDKDLFHKGQIGFGWFHAVQGIEITDLCIEKKLTAIAWEEMFDRNRHIFWENNYIAGKASAIDVMRFLGKTFDDLNIAMLGRGNTALGALEILNKFSANVKVYSRNTIELFKEEISDFDVIFNCVLWDPTRTDRILYKDDIKKMKKGAAIVDISCNHRLEIETSYPTTIENPIYYEEGILHYAVDHTPTLLYKDASCAISKCVLQYLNYLIDNNFNSVLENSIIIRDGIIIDRRITDFQKRNK
jgi:N5-(carboxyethyl)ornithine synthase